MGANNYGNANITFRYKHPAKAENFNSVLRGVCPSGIYKGGTVSYIGNILTLAPYTAIFESSNDKATTITTISAIDLSTVTTFGGNASSSTPYVIMRYVYSNVISNYPDYYQVAIDDIQTTDIIICKVLFDGGGVVTGIDYSESHIAPQYSKDLDTYNIFCDTYVKGKKINKEVTTDIDVNMSTSELTCDTSLFFSPTADRTLDITAGASFADTNLYVYNNGTDYKITVTYFETNTVVLTSTMFTHFKWNGSRWVVMFESGDSVTAIVASHGFLPRSQCPIMGNVDFIQFSSQPYIAAASEKLLIAIANGADINGHKNYIIEYSDNVTPSGWANAQSGEYLYIEYDENNKTISYGKTLLAPQAGYSFPAATAGNYYYLINNRLGYVWNGSEWVKTLRLYLGYMSSASTVVSAAINAKYEYVMPTVVSRGAYDIPNRLFSSLYVEADLYAEVTTAVCNYAVGDVVKMEAENSLLSTAEVNPKGILLSIGSTNLVVSASRELLFAYKRNRWDSAVIGFDYFQFRVIVERSYA